MVNRILIVDDEKSIRHTFQIFLKKEGYIVFVANNAEEAIEVFMTKPIDLVITDIVMPKITGLELAKELRVIDDEVPIIIMTGEPTLDTAKHAVKEHVYDYVVKPINKETLLKITANALREKELINSKKILEEDKNKYRIQLEEALDEKSKSLEAMNMVVDFSPIPMMIFNPYTEKVLLCNQALESLINHRFQGESMSIRRFVSKSDQDKVVDEYRKHQKIENIDIQITPLNKESIWCSLNMRSINYLSQKAALFTLVNLDESKKIQANLQKARDDAEAAALLKSNFLANMSHEIRTPMNAVLGFNELLATTSLNDIQKDYVSKINQSGKGLLAIINDILDFSKIEAGHLMIESIPVNIPECVEGAIDAISIRAMREEVEIEKYMDAAIPKKVLADPMRLGQVLRNLIDNAVKFTKKGYVHIDISLKKNEENNEVIQFAVVDTGIGMNEDQVANLFKPFVQGDSTTTRLFGGTGLGLIISNRLIESMGGKLTVYSEEGIGSRFVFDIPLEKPSGEMDYQRQVLSQHKQDRTYASGACRILLVEDNELNRMVICGLLENEGYDIDIALHGECAIRRTSNKQYDLILMDLQMPYMDGYQATKLLRQQSDYSSIPIIALSADVMDGTRDRVLSAGMSDYISKPISRDELLATINKWCNNQCLLRR